MISTILIEYSGAVPFLFFALLAACAAVGWLLVGTGERGHRWARGLAVVALLAVVPLTLYPDGAHRWAFCSVQFSLPWLGAGDNLANLAMMLPAAFFGTLATRRPLAVAAAGSGLSALIEFTQALLPVLGRSCDTDDWEMNTIGVAAGTVLGWGLVVLVQRTIRSGNNALAVRPGSVGRGPSYWVVSAATAVAVVACVVLADLHARPSMPTPQAGACNGNTAARPTRLPDGMSAYAGGDGGICVLTETARLHFPPSASGPQLMSDDQKWQLGVAQPGTRHLVDPQGVSVRLLAVEGSQLRVWAAPAR